jgi:hypothetical protein
MPTRRTDKVNPAQISFWADLQKRPNEGNTQDMLFAEQIKVKQLPGTNGEGFVWSREDSHRCAAG